MDPQFDLVVAKYSPEIGKQSDPSLSPSDLRHEQLSPFLPIGHAELDFSTLLQDPGFQHSGIAPPIDLGNFLRIPSLEQQGAAEIQGTCDGFRHYLYVSKL